MRQDRAAGKDFDVIDAIVRQLTNHLAHFPWTVGFPVVQVPREFDVGCKSGQGTRAARDGHISTRHKHTRTDDIAALDGIPQSDISQRAVSADVTHGGESGFEHGVGIGYGFERDLRRCLFELNKWITVVRAVSKVCVAVDQAGKHGHPTEVDDGDIRRELNSLPDFFDLVVTNQDDLIG